MPKSGTHSIASIFARKLRSAHEPEARRLRILILKWARSECDASDVGKYVKSKDKRLRLHVDSSNLNFFLLRFLLDEFPEAKFVLTIRHPYDWLRSLVNHRLTRGYGDQHWVEIHKIRFREDFYSHSEEERPLKEHSLQTLDGYFSYWSYHNSTVLRFVPPDRLFIVRTDKITQSIPALGEFVGCKISPDELDDTEVHAFKAKKQYHLLESIEPKFVHLKMHYHCHELMNRFFAD